jgi:prepilin-type processing-associated H-X9-DG protein
MICPKFIKSSSFLARLGIIVSIIALLIVGIFIYASVQVFYQIDCGLHMSEIGKAMLLNPIEDPSRWCDLLIDRANIKPELFKCKGAGNGRCNYAMNKNIGQIQKSTPVRDGQAHSADIANIVALFECKPGEPGHPSRDWNQCGGPELLTTQNHHGKGCNILFMDGHVECVKTKDLSKLKWTAD